jgi:uncharacterized membrane protein (UPF0127 family)
MRKKILIAMILGVFGLLALTIFLLSSRTNWIKIENTAKTKLPLTQIELANTAITREKGLMYRDSLCQSCGMLFEFANQESRSFWMKDTKISLDIIFIDENGKIVKIFEDTSINNTQTLYTASAKYILEINAKNDFGLTENMTLDILDLQNKAIKLV